MKSFQSTFWGGGFPFWTLEVKLPRRLHLTVQHILG